MHVYIYIYVYIHWSRCDEKESFVDSEKMNVFSAMLFSPSL